MGQIKAMSARFRSKTKKVEGIYVKAVTETFIKRLLTDCTTGRGWADIKSEKTLFSCQECIKAYCSEKSLQAHIEKIHKNNKDLICSLCKTVYKTKVNLSRHIEKYHDKSLDQMKSVKKTKENITMTNPSKSTVDKVPDPILKQTTSKCEINPGNKVKRNIKFKTTRRKATKLITVKFVMKNLQQMKNGKQFKWSQNTKEKHIPLINHNIDWFG